MGDEEFRRHAAKGVVGCLVDAHQDVHRVVRVDSLAQLYVVALARCDGARRDLGGRNGVEAVEEVGRLRAAVIALGAEKYLIQACTNLHSQEIEHLASDVKGSEAVALGGQRAVHSLSKAIRVKALHNAAEVGFQRAGRNVKIGIVAAVHVVRTEFHFPREFAKNLAACHARACGHMLQGCVGCHNGHHEQFLSVLHATLLQFCVGDVKRKCHFV